MKYEINETHDPNLKSWLESANDPNTDFPIQNLPFCSFLTKLMASSTTKFLENLPTDELMNAVDDVGREKAIEAMKEFVGESKSIDEAFQNMGASFGEGETLSEFDDDETVKPEELLKKLFGFASYRMSIGVAIGDQIFHLQDYMIQGHMDQAISFFNSKNVPENLIERQSYFRRAIYFMPAMVKQTRSELVKIFSENADQETREKVQPFLIPASELCFTPIVDIGDYTDFYCSIFHATNVGKLFRPDNPLFENYKYIPIGYHGRASSIVPSETDVKRPKGQNRSDPSKPPVYIPSKALDYEMEVGFFVGKHNKLGDTVSIEDAEEHILGLCLVNDWSARDIQGWEYQPLGPFLGKSFATTISPFVVSMEALAPFRVPAFERDDGDPAPLDYLSDETNEKLGGIDIKLEVYIQTKKMRDENIEPHLLSRSNMKDLYWTIGQMLTHHTSNGCNIKVGDLMATGTISGEADSARGSMLEITKRGSEPIELPSGETRKFLEDYDEIIMKGFCEREGFRRIGFGECRGIVLPAD